MQTMNKYNIILGELSKREIDVLELLAQGCCNKTIAEKLFISYETVNTHRKNINKKIDLKVFYLLICQLAKEK